MEKSSFAQQLEQAAVRYQQAKADATHLGHRVRFAEAALESARDQAIAAEIEADRALSEVVRLAREGGGLGGQVLPEKAVSGVYSVAAKEAPSA